MQKQNEDFLQKYNIEFPQPSALAILHAEPVSIIKNQGYTFSDEALEIINDLVVPSGLSGGQFNKWIASGDDPSHHQIIFFFDRAYHIAHHIYSIRKTWDEIAMTSYLGPEAQNDVFENPPPAGLLYVADVPTLTNLAQQSPCLGLLLPIADGQPDDMIWAYFLGGAARLGLERVEFDEIEPF
jgi:hypothetical protein